MTWTRVAWWFLLTAAVACHHPDTKSPNISVEEDEQPLDSVAASVDFPLPPLTALMGDVKPTNDSAFAELPRRMASRDGLYLRLEARDAFVAMHDSAQAEGIPLMALSATRTRNHQTSIWDRKWRLAKYMGWSDIDKARDILRYSSMPGSSRHHWGTDVDIHSVEPEAFLNGEGAEILAWLRERAHEFGFAEVYTSDSSRTGYQPEAWHWSYLPLAGPYLDAVNEAQRQGTLPGFEGFEGAHVADTLRIVEEYINGIGTK